MVSAVVSFAAVAALLTITAGLDTMLVLRTALASGVVVAARRLRGWVGRPRVRRRLEQLCGLVFIGFGLRLAVEHG